MRALVFRSAYSASRNARASAAFAASIEAHCAVSSETLMLQVRSAHPPMPHRTSSSSRSGISVGLLSYLRAIPPFGALAFRSAYWLRQTLELQSLRDLRQAQTLDLQVRFAHPPMPHRTGSSSCSGVSHGLFMISHHRPCGRWCFARLIRQAETLELQLHSQPPSKRTALSPLKRSCSRFAPLTLRCRTEPALRAAPVFRMAYLPYLTVFRMQAKQIQRLPLRGAGAKRLKGGPWG